MGLCTNLQTLCISSNRLTSLPETFSRLRELRVLKAEKNLIVEIGFKIKFLSKLAQLHLGCNLLPCLEEDLGHMQGLEDLAVHRNKIEVLPPALAGLEKTLKVFRLEDNPLHSPPLEIVYRGKVAIFQFLKRMQFGFHSWDLDLGNMQLKTVPFPLLSAMQWEKEFWCRLKQLSLRNNVITSLPQDVQLMTNLTILDISSNRLSTIPPTIAILFSVKILDASCNRIQALPTEMSKNVSLEELLLENNLLKSIPVGVFHLKRLHDLRLSSNKLISIPDDVHALHHLRHLSLDFNGIMNLPSSLSGLISIKTLRLNNNRLLELPPGLTKIRPSNKPPPIHRSKKELVRQSVVGKINPAVRRKRIRNILYGGGHAGNYRATPQVPFELREFAKPAAAGDRRGWDLVRFALFGPAGPHLNAKPPPPVQPPAEDPVAPAAGAKEAGAADGDEEDDGEEAGPVRVGFVARLRGLFSVFRGNKAPVPAPAGDGGDGGGGGGDGDAPTKAGAGGVAQEEDKAAAGKEVGVAGEKLARGARRAARGGRDAIQARYSVPPRALGRGAADIAHRRRLGLG